MLLMCAYMLYLVDHSECNNNNQRTLSKKLECQLFNTLLGASSMADRAHI